MIVFIIVVIAFVLLLIFMAMPTFRRHSDRKLLEGLKIAHRGLHNAEIPENSISAFLEAAARGYGIENDIRQQQYKQIENLQQQIEKLEYCIEHSNKDDVHYIVIQNDSIQYQIKR